MSTLNDILGLIGPALTGLNAFGIGGNGLTSLLSGIPPQELSLLSGENQLMGGQITEENLKNQILQTVFPQFLKQVNAINPNIASPEINKINQLVNQGTGFINSATPTLNAAKGFINDVSPIAGQAQDFVNSMTPDINKLSDLLLSRMNLGSPYYQQHQREVAEQGAQQFNNQSGMLRQQIDQSGFGAAPTGLAASEQGELARQAGQVTSENWLQNLFQNENLQLQAAGMFPQVPQLRGTQSTLEQGIGGLRLGQGQGMEAVGGQQIGQGLGMGQMGNVTGAAGNLALGEGQLQASKAGLLSPLPALNNNPRLPNIPFITPQALPSINVNSSQGGGGGGGFLGGLASLFGF